MQWIRKGRQLGQAVKNVQRLRHIIAVFSKHGFVELFQRMNLERFLPSRLAAYAEAQGDKSIQERLRLSFEELGPTFVKLGQLLSTRSDLLPDSFIEEFTKLQDNVRPLTFESVQAVIEKELGKPLLEAYSSFDATPLAAASIGQVHAAVLNTGEKVVVKVQRPEIEKMIFSDISLLAFLAGLMEKYIPESRILSPKTIVDEFFRTLSYELDFVVEANNMGKMAQNLAIFPDIVIPMVYKGLSTHKILTLERLEGIPVNDLKALTSAGIDLKHIARVGALAFFRSVMIDGIFHGDLHGGNLFILPGNKLGIIDFGIVGRLSQKARDQLANMVMFLLTEDFENLCYQYAELGTSTSAVDFDTFQREVRNSIAPYLGLSLSEVNIGKVLIESTKIATRHQIKIPGEWMIVFKAILTMEGMGRTLDPDFDLLKLGEEITKELVKNQYSMQRLSKDFLWIAKDISSLLQVLPRQLRWMFKKLSTNDFAIEIRSPDLENIRAQMDLNGRRLSLSVLTIGLFLASSVSVMHPVGHTIGDYPVVAVVFFGAGCLFLGKLLLKSFK
ncbi:AarF/UbiB family protein [Bdellovibrionota bacterium FG-2]